MNPIHVLKFGGTSVADADAFRRVAQIVRAAQQRGTKPVVVTSAVGGVTDRLLSTVRYAVHDDAEPLRQALGEIVERHESISHALLAAEARGSFAHALEAASGRITNLLRVLGEHPGTRPALEDEIVSYGERLSSHLLSLVLAQSGLPSCLVDARACIRTDGEHGNASPLRDATQSSTRAVLLPHIEEDRVPVLGGFIASSLENATTTLGRGGSDFSAALVGAAVKSAEIEIWTDVNGFLTADPRVVPGASTIAHLSYGEAAELAYFGAKVLHPRTIQPAIEAGIPLRICNSRQPEAGGTLIDAQRAVSPRGVKAIAHKRGITMVQVTSARMLGAYGFLRALFEVFDRHKTSVDIVATSEVSVSLTVDAPTDLPAIVSGLEVLGDVRVERGYGTICVVGEGLRSTPGIAARAFGALRDINVVLISHGASTTNLTLAVPDESVPDAVTELHATFFGAGKGSAAAPQSRAMEPHAGVAGP